MNEEHEKNKEKLIQEIAESMRLYGFTFEFKLCENPEGIKVVFEVTQEELDELVNAMGKRKRQKQ